MTQQWFVYVGTAARGLNLTDADVFSLLDILRSQTSVFSSLTSQQYFSTYKRKFGKVKATMNWKGNIEMI